MCGFAGISFLAECGSKQEDIVRKMADALSHRGPDDVGVWFSHEAGIALAHRRLSVIDVSPAGHQPMISHSDRYVIVLNGEIYNHLVLRNELSEFDIAWHGHSDTEVLLAAIDHWGVETVLKKAVGMFAFALWDRKDHSLILARDRFGEKPLYYGWQGDTFLFGSELKALCKHPSFKSEINHEVVPLYLRKGYIPSPWSIWKGIYKLNPGSFLCLDHQDPGVLPDPVRFWSLSDAALKGANDPFVGSDEEALAELEDVLSGAVSKQMVADVPLGAFLSGGIDSTTVVALMQSQSKRAVKTFCIGFTEDGFNEAEHAYSVARYLGTDHTELYVTAEQSRAVIPSLPTIYDEPFGDPSAIPTFLVSQLARQHVTVSLSGDGGDELFGGYPHYQDTAAVWNTVNQIPLPLRRLLGSGIGAVFPPLPSSTTQSKGGLRALFAHYNRFKSLGLQMQLPNIAELFEHRRAIWKDEPILAGSIIRNGECSVMRENSSLDAISYLMQLEGQDYLPDDIMVKVDRAAMAVSLESRAPLLDHNVAEFAWRLPMNFKIRDQQGKWILRELLYRHVPRHLVDRPKAGFSVPVNAWLRGPLREWAEMLLNEKMMREQGIFDADAVRDIWNQFVDGKIEYGYQFWVLLMFQAWMLEE